MTALAAFLVQGDQPVAFDCKGVAKQGRIGRSQPFDNPDAAQNRLPAARPVNSPSGPISR